MIALRLSTWLLILGAILLLVFLTFGVLARDPLEAWYWRNSAAPDLQRDLGFVAQAVGHPTIPGKALVITSVTPGGVFDRAGVRAADRPWDIHGREEVTFFRQLEQARGSSTTLALVRPGGLAGRGDMALIVHVPVAVPK